MLPKSENSRRTNINKIQSYVKIFVNNVFLAKSKIVNLNWPEYSFQFDYLFNMTINTRPTRIHLEFYLKNGWGFDKICIIELNPPGIYMNTVTSSSSLIEEIPFDNSSSKNKDNNTEEIEKIKNKRRFNDNNENICK
jgi:hypothetical protein